MPNPPIRTIANNETNYLSIPYVKNLYERIKPLFKNHNYKVVGRSATSLNNTIFSKTKDPIPLNQQSNLVYQVKCTCDMIYTGQTKQFLGIRIGQHRNGSTKNTNEVATSALSQHLKDTQHVITLDNVKIVDKEKNLRKRSILEMLHIKSSQNSMNIRGDVEYIGSSYDFFI